MAHFAQLDGNDNVMQVIVVGNDDILDENGNESEIKGIQFCKSLLGADTNWAQTSYNSRFRRNYAGIGYHFDRARDAFIPPKPYNSWILNETTCLWEPPIPYPVNNDISIFYVWDEENLNWKEMQRTI